ncbi:hypothetical protein AX15_001484 [Amanita polypyramis BW_CC]|nr:hypothetical protein AX15_001484 [Amanita polypyramis BW_CC]
MDYDSIKVLLSVSSPLPLLTAFQALHAVLSPFAPLVPVALLPYLALLSLALTFALAFYFSTLPKDPIPFRETAVALAASVLGGFGIVTLFCSVGVYV